MVLLPKKLLVYVKTFEKVKKNTVFAFIIGVVCLEATWENVNHMKCSTCKYSRCYTVPKFNVLTSIPFSEGYVLY